MIRSTMIKRTSQMEADLRTDPQNHSKTSDFYMTKSNWASVDEFGNVINVLLL